MGKRHWWRRRPPQQGWAGLAPLAATGPFPPARVAAPTAAELIERVELARLEADWSADTDRAPMVSTVDTGGGADPGEGTGRSTREVAVGP